MSSKYILTFLAIVLLLIGCKEDVFPKPKAKLRLKYPKAIIRKSETDNFQFQYNDIAKIKTIDLNSLTLYYSSMKATIFITYKKINGNLEKLLIDAQKMTYGHTIKADNITPKLFINAENKVYGMIHDVSGNTASQVQFYATDSVNHFVVGSLYFNANPNYDSIYPAVAYLKNDIKKFMESLRWK